VLAVTSNWIRDWSPMASSLRAAVGPGSTDIHSLSRKCRSAPLPMASTVSSHARPPEPERDTAIPLVTVLRSALTCSASEAW